MAAQLGAKTSDLGAKPRELGAGDELDVGDFYLDTSFQPSIDSILSAHECDPERP